MATQTASDIKALGIELINPPEIIIPEKKNRLQSDILNVSIDPIKLSLKELFLYFSSHFEPSEETPKRKIIELFFGENQLLESEDFMPQKSKRYIEAQILEFPEIQNSHEIEDINIDSEIINFPQIIKQEKPKINSTLTLDEIQNTLQESFKQIIFALAQDSENLLWFAGINEKITISDNTASKINDLDFQIKKYEDFNYLDFLESGLAIFIHYYFPHLVTKESLEKKSPKAKIEEKISFKDLLTIS